MWGVCVGVHKVSMCVMSQLTFTKNDNLIFRCLDQPVYVRLVHALDLLLYANVYSYANSQFSDAPFSVLLFNEYIYAWTCMFGKCSTYFFIMSL